MLGSTASTPGACPPLPNVTATLEPRLLAPAKTSPLDGYAKLVPKPSEHDDAAGRRTSEACGTSGVLRGELTPAAAALPAPMHRLPSKNSDVTPENRPTRVCEASARVSKVGSMPSSRGVVYPLIG